MSGRFSLCAAGLIVCVVLGCTKQEQADFTPRICNSDEVEAAIAAAKGKVVLVYCWATTSKASVDTFPVMLARQRSYGDKGLVVITVSMDDDAADVAGVLKRAQANFTNLRLKREPGAEERLNKALNLSGSLPRAVLFGKSGKLLWGGHPADNESADVIENELGI
jgi:hypothetical protein